MSITRTVTILLSLTACGDTDRTDPDAPPAEPPPTAEGDFIVTGPVAPNGPPGAKVFGIWSGDSDKGDFLFKHGAGTANSTAFAIGFDEPVPELATFGDVFGVGLIALFDGSVAIPDGVVADPSTVENGLVGATSSFAVIYNGQKPGAPEWVAAFPAGLSCGTCVRSGESFDTFAPVACSEVALDVGDEDTLDICNWR
jgi:hypothetical protein